MPPQQTVSDLKKEVVEDYLTVAAICVDTLKGDGSIHGYAATLLLMATLDAMGHALCVGSGYTLLSVLRHPPFKALLDARGQQLTVSHIGELTNCYRRLLGHAGLMTPNVALTPDRQDPPFDFSGGQLAVIRVPALLDLVNAAWNSCKDTITPHFGN